MTIKFYKTISKQIDCTLWVSTSDGNSNTATEEDLKAAGYIPASELNESINQYESTISQLNAEIDKKDNEIKLLKKALSANEATKEPLLFARKLSELSGYKGRTVVAIVNEEDFNLLQDILANKYNKQFFSYEYVRDYSVSCVRLLNGKLIHIPFTDDNPKRIIRTQDIVNEIDYLYPDNYRTEVTRNLAKKFHTTFYDATLVINNAVRNGAIEERGNMLYTK